MEDISLWYGDELGKRAVSCDAYRGEVLTLIRFIALARRTPVAV